MRREIPKEERRVVTRRKKIAILMAFVIGIVAIIWFKLPFERTYTETLVQTDAGETALYGETIDVSVHVRVKRYFFRSPTHEGTVTVEGDTFSNVNGTFVPTFSLTGAMEDPSSFLMVCSEWQGSYLLTRCIAHVEDGMITHVYLKDGAGVYAGQYDSQ
ncbi:MAG: hypothetical protein IKB87_05195 [Clostridia bacterium]|nr:hypothetical protein [Clostridia bacterium]